ncbi:hypothetical protein GCM10018789_59720 [Streptomyces werraensis]|nr:hypothetical protein GCM10018789_59720 [Streptomyces werraensis]
MFLPLLGPWLALSGMLIPFAIFFPSPSLAALRPGAQARVTFAWSWRRLLQMRTLALPLTLLAISCGALVVAPFGSPAYWLALGSVPVQVAAFTVGGAVEVRVTDAVKGARPRLAAGTSGASVVVALLSAVSAGTFAQVFRDRVREVVAGTGPPPADRTGDIVRWADAQLVSSVFGPTYDRQWYWAFLVGAAALLAAGCGQLLRNAFQRARSGTDPFQGASGGNRVTAESTGKVFLSYSRQDTYYARELCSRLEGRLGELWVDWQAIHPSEHWRESIAEAIRTSDAVVVLLSRHALKSPYCWDECRQAIEQRKRVLPVVIDPGLERGSTSGLMREHGWDALTAYQYLSLVEPDDDGWARGVESIVAFVHQHHRWVAFHARLGVLAHQWWEGGRSDGQLLRADELSVAEAWRRRAPDEEEFHVGLTERQRRYLEESRRSVRRRALLVRSALAAGTATVLGLSGLVAAGQAGAEEQYRAALSRELAALAGEVSVSEPEKALQYALAARGQADTTEARNAVAERLNGFNQVRTVIAPEGHRVDDVVFSAAGDVLLVVRGNATEVWDVKRARSRGRALGIPLWSGDSPGHALTADGRTMALLAGRDRVDLVDTRTLEIKDSFSTPAGEALQRLGGLSRDGEHLLVDLLPGTTNDFGQVVWDVRRHRFAGRTDCTNTSMAPSGRRFACTSADRTEIVDIGTLRRESVAEGGHFVGFTADDAVVVNVSGETHIHERGAGRRWTPVPGSAVTSMTSGGSALFGGRYAVFVLEADRYELWDLEGRRRVGSASSVEKAAALRRDGSVPEFERLRPDVEAETADGSLVATAAGDGSVVLWEPGGAGRVSRRLSVPEEDGFYAVSPDAQTVAAAVGRTVSLWDTGTDTRTGRFRLSRPAGLPAFSADGSLLAVAQGIGEGRLAVEVFRVRDGRRISRFDAGSDERNHIASLMFSPDGKRLYAVLTGWAQVVAWNVADSGSKFRKVAESDGYADHAALSPDGTLLAVTGRNGTVGLWDAASGRRVRLIHDAGFATFSPDGKTLAARDTSDSRTVFLWDVVSGRRTGVEIAPRGKVFMAEWDPQGRRLAITGSPEGGLVDDPPVTVWELSSRRQSGPQLPTADVVTAVGFSPTGDRMVTAGRDGTWISDITADGWLSSLCGMVTRRLSAAQWQDVAPGERYRWPC